MGTMSSGYRGTPLIKKLGIKPGMRTHVRRAPADYADVKVCAVNGTWSGLKLVIRQEARS
jgi:hypothetical protein